MLTLVSFNKEPNSRHFHALDERWKRRAMNPPIDRIGQLPATCGRSMTEKDRQ
jgi:hypothetical protein